jgi:hypothetical protein
MLVLIILLSVLSSIFEKYGNSENFDNVVSLLNQSSGFYSVLFFSMNHYIYCKKNKKNFKINDDGWLYKYNNGWTDYFEYNTLIFDYLDNNDTTNVGHGNTLDDFSIQEYKNIIPEYYIYNEQTKNEINKVKTKFNLIDNEYGAIYIRRGDKLISESEMIEDDVYIKLLLEKDPNCETIFLQTDDYTSFVGLTKYINENNLNIKLYTLCDENSLGAIVFDHQKSALIDSVNNTEYIKNNNIGNTTQNKAVDEMNADEKYKHTIDLIIGNDILMKSKICVTDFQSNVARFVKLAHNNSDNVFDVLSPNEDIDYSKKICPAYAF